MHITAIFTHVVLELCKNKNLRHWFKTLSIERNPLPAKNQTLRSYRVYIFHLRSRHNQLLFQQNLLIRLYWHWEQG